MNWKNFFLLRLSLFFSKKKNKGPCRKILVISTTALGDTLWATPALDSLRASFPLAYIGVLTSQIGAEVLKNNPAIDRLYIARPPLFFRFFPLLHLLCKKSFDTVLIFHASQRLMFPLARLTKASRIVGSLGFQKGLDALLTDALDAKERHEVQRRLDMVTCIGGVASHTTLRFFLGEKKTKRQGKWVMLHPGSKDRYKRWPETHFALLARHLQERLHCRILVSGNVEEKALMDSICSAAPGAETIPPDLSLHAFGAELSRVHLLITNDTGPFHLASALNLPAIGIYVPTDPQLCGPFGFSSGEALSVSRTCIPCLGRGCRSPFCFLQIGVEEVFQKAKQKLEIP